MKKVFGWFVLFLLVVSTMGFVIGQEIGNEEIAAGAKTAGAAIADFISQLLQPLYGDNAWAGKLLLGFLLFLIVWTVIPYIFGDHKVVNPLIAGVISVLSILAIPDIFFSAIIAQYGAMGATILSVIPFMIIFVLSVMIRYALLARVIWIVYAIYYFTLYVYLTVQIFIADGKWVWVSTNVPNTLPYIAAMVVGFFLFFKIDWFRDLIFQGKMGALEETGDRIIQRGGLLHKLQKEELEVVYGQGDRL